MDGHGAVGKIRSEIEKLHCHEPDFACVYPRITVPPLPPGYLCAAVRRVKREVETGTAC